MEHVQGTTGDDVALQRQMADQIGCWCESDFLVLTGWTPTTLEQYRKRRYIDYIRLGRHYYYPRAQAVEKLKAGATAQRRVPARGLL
jgi:hypothetical protein